MSYERQFVLLQTPAPAGWVAMLSRVVDAAPEGLTAVIAGGAVRDTVACKPVKDIDIWFPGWTAGEVEAAVAQAGGTIHAWTTHPDDHGYHALRVRGVAKASFPDAPGLPVDLVIPYESTVMATLSEFDMAISHSYINHHGEVWLHSMALRDLRDMRFRFVRLDERTTRRFYESIRPRYPDWVPEFDPLVCP